MINVLDENGLTRMYFHSPQGAGRAALGHVDGAAPASGAYRYYTHDRNCRTGVRRTRRCGAERRWSALQTGVWERGGGMGVLGGMRLIGPIGHIRHIGAMGRG